MNYLNNKDLYVEIIVSKAQGKLSNKAKKMLELLATNVIEKKSYWSMDDKMDCYQSGLLALFSRWYNFDEELYDNAFAYYTEIFKRGSAECFNTIYKKRGDPNNNIRIVSIEGTNDGQGMYSI